MNSDDDLRTTMPAAGPFIIIVVHLYFDSLCLVRLDLNFDEA